MALAEARAAWQRTANRCLVQEDAKRAPKLACCSSGSPPYVKQAETGPTSTAGSQDIPNSGPLPFNRNPSYSNLSPNTRWWLQLQPNYGYQKCLMDEPFASSNGSQKVEDDDYELVDQPSHVKSQFDNQCRNFITCEKKDFTVSFAKNTNDLYFDSESSWVGAEKDAPWWRTADTEELAQLVAQRSLDHIENCDLPSPQNAHVKKNLSVNVCCFNRDQISTAERSFRKLSMPAGNQLVSGVDKPSIRDRPQTHDQRMSEMDDDASKARLLEALRHSQTRAREAEKVAKQARTDKEHVVKLVFRQASQLFAYRQWLQLLQLENTYFQFRTNDKIQSASSTVMLPAWTTPRTRKLNRKGWQKPLVRKRAKRCRARFDFGKYAVIFALGLGLVGAGLLLGWTIGWMLPTW